jgi:hypothetical protein
MRRAGPTSAMARAARFQRAEPNGRYKPPVPAAECHGMHPVRFSAMSGRQDQATARPEDHGLRLGDGPAARNAGGISGPNPRHSAEDWQQGPCPLVAPEAAVGKGRLPHGQASVGRLRTKSPHRLGHRPHARRRRSRTGGAWYVEDPGLVSVRDESAVLALEPALGRDPYATPPGRSRDRGPGRPSQRPVRSPIAHLAPPNPSECIASAAHAARQKPAGRRGPRRRRARDSTGQRRRRPR